MSDHVKQELAARLQAAGWEGETEFVYPRAKRKKTFEDRPWHISELETCESIFAEQLPAPSIGELRERLTLDDFHAYYLTLHFVYDKSQRTLRPSFDKWLYTVTADADALAEVWLWKEGKL